MSEEVERMKKKNLLLSYYSNNNINQMADSSSITTTASSSSLNAPNPNLSSPTSKDSSSNTGLTNNTKDPLDINSTSFEPDLYLRKLIRERNLAEIFDG